MLHVKIISPRQMEFEGSAKSVALPGYNGEMEVLPEHAEYTLLLKEGAIRLDLGQSSQVFSLTGTGLASISHDQVSLFVDQAEEIPYV